MDAVARSATGLVTSMTKRYGVLSASLPLKLSTESSADEPVMFIE